MFVDLESLHLNNDQLPQKLASAALKFGRIRTATVYLGSVLHYYEAGAWQRAGIEPSLVAAEDINADILEHSLLTGEPIDSVVVVSASDARKDVLRRLKKYVKLVTLIGTGSDETKRSAHYFIPIHDVVPFELRPPDNVAEKYRRLIKAVSRASLTMDFVGMSRLQKVIVPEKVGIRDFLEVKKLIDDATNEGILEVYHEGGVVACRLNEKNELVGSLREAG